MFLITRERGNFVAYFSMLFTYCNNVHVIIILFIYLLYASLTFLLEVCILFFKICIAGKMEN